MHLFLTSMSVVYVLSTPIPGGGDNASLDDLRKMIKWENDDCIYRGLILNGMSDTFFNIYQFHGSAKELWDSLEAKYMVEDASSKKFFVSNYIYYKTVDSKPVIEHYNELLSILGRFTQHKMNMDEAILVFYFIDKLFPSWKDFKHTLKHKVPVELGSRLRIEESLRAYTDKEGKRKHHDNTKTDPSKKSKMTCWMCGKTGHLKRDCKGVKIGNKPMDEAQMVQGLDDDVVWWLTQELGHVHFKRMQDMSKNRLIPAFDMDTEKCKTCMLNIITKKPFQNVKRETEVLELIHSDICDLHATFSLGNKKYFMKFIDDAYRVPNKRNMITPYELWTKKKPNLNYLRVWGCKAVVRLLDPKLKTLGERGIECIFVGYAEYSKAFRFYVIQPNDSVNPEEVTEEVVQQPEPELRKSKRNRTPKDFGPEFQLYLIEGTRDEVSDQHSYCFNIEDDPKTFDKAMKSQDVAFWKETINDEMDSIMGNNTWVLVDLHPGCKPLGCK
ncbi:zinc finger, CCHC-type containing protein [Tanacetum coccineum]|uniref:Zinc finger, CCHC-type containing protein n=1 Tax=Tanacetum coccineum TaxID=301880 RepID=A0ABQ5BKU4_9ASTR